MKVLIKTAFFALACGLAAASAPAQQPAAEDDIATHIISVPVPDRYRVDGLQHGARVHNDPTVQGGKALRVPVPVGGLHPRSIVTHTLARQPARV